MKCKKNPQFLQNISSTINQLMTAMVIFVGVHLVFTGGLSAGILVGFNMLAGRVSRPIIDLVTLKTEIAKLLQSLQMVSGIVDANSETTVRVKNLSLWVKLISKKLNLVMMMKQKFLRMWILKLIHDKLSE